MPSAVRAPLVLGCVLVVVSALGYAVAETWYHDDACYIAEWKCEVGDLGFAAFFWGGALGGLSLLVGTTAAGITAIRRRGDDASRSE